MRLERHQTKADEWLITAYSVKHFGEVGLNNKDTAPNLINFKISSSLYNFPLFFINVVVDQKRLK